MHPSVPIEAKPCEGRTLWHLCWQAAVGRDFLLDAELGGRIRARILDSHRQSGRVLIGFLLTPTELHAVSQISSGDSTSRIARGVGNVVSRWVNSSQPMRSPVLAGRYRAHPIETIEEMRAELHMLAWRPVFLGLCSTPSHYRHGAVRIALGLTPAQGFDARPLLRTFDDSVPKARSMMRTWMASRPYVSPRPA